MLIPKKIHYVWVGGRPLPQDAARAVAQWQRIMPDFSIQLWNEANIDFSPRFSRGAYAVRAFNRVSDYVRMQALYRHGGIYMDHDVEVLRDFTPLLGSGCFLGCQTACRDEADLVNGAVIGATPGHPFIARLLAELDRLDGRADLGAQTGPGLVSAALRAAGLTEPPTQTVVIDGVTIFPPEYFYPYPWQGIFDPACITGNTYAVHHWAHTWKKDKSLRPRLVRRLNAEIARISVTAGFALQRLCNGLLRRMGEQSG